jgi:segregation and condensation protein B
MNTSQLIEAILFHLAEPVSAKEISRLIKKPINDTRVALSELQHSFQGRGIQLMTNNDEYTLVTAKEASIVITEITKDELSKDLSKAAIETLAIVLYRGPITRSDIDYIRGVNSTFILRNLLIRGLVEKIENPKDQRSFLYQPTMELLQYLGITSVADLPEYSEIESKIATFTEDIKTDDTIISDENTDHTHAEVNTDTIISDTQDIEIDADNTEEDLTGKEYIDPDLHEEQDLIEDKI